MRLINDYRNIANKANVSISAQRCQCGERGVRVEAEENIKPGQELLLDYGGDYWAAVKEPATSSSSSREDEGEAG